MWLITTFIAAIGATAAYLATKNPREYRLDWLSLMLWGAALMMLVDHILGYEGGEFLEFTTDGLVSNGFVLGITMLIPVFAVWEVATLISKQKGR